MLGINKIARNLVKIVVSAYTHLIIHKHQEVNFWVLYSFIITFSVSRLIVYYFPFFTLLRFDGVHVHHFAYGVVILAIVGFLSLNGWHHRKLRLSAILYGIGLGLAMDEFGMWIRLQDDYWMRRSYDAVMIVGALLVSSVYFGKFWEGLFFKIVDLFKTTKN